MEDYGWEKISIKGIAFFVGEDHDPIGFWATVFLDKSVRVNIMNIRKKVHCVQCFERELQGKRHRVFDPYLHFWVEKVVSPENIYLRHSKVV